MDPSLGSHVKMTQQLGCVAGGRGKIGACVQNEKGRIVVTWLQVRRVEILNESGG